MTATTITIPGSVYYDALDPLCSGMAEEIGLPTPTPRKRGKGTQFVYEDITHEQAEEVAEYIGDRGELLLGQDTYGAGDDPGVKRERDTHRAAIKTAARIREQVRRERMMRQAIEAPVSHG